jgi:hypothetical protein
VVDVELKNPADGIGANVAVAPDPLSPKACVLAKLGGLKLV